MGDWYFTYDTLDRVASATPDVSAPTKYLNNYLCWTYNVYGNWTLETFSTVPCTGTNPTPQLGANYNARNQIVNTFDGRGTTFVYDLPHWMENRERVELCRGANNRRAPIAVQPHSSITLERYVRETD
jgi:hypothetical protein